MLSIDKGSIIKRLSAFILDMMMILIIFTGCMLVLSKITNYDSYSNTVTEKYEEYGNKYGIDYDISASEYESLDQETKDKYELASKDMANDQEAVYAYRMTITLGVMIISLGLLVAYLILNFIVPLALGNGQSLGMKIFGLAVMKMNCVKITPLQLFVRSILGKYTIGTMIPVLTGFMVINGTIGFGGIVLCVGILLVQLTLSLFSKYRTPIPDLLAYTVVVDISTQKIFESEKDLLDYKTSKAKELADTKIY